MEFRQGDAQFSDQVIREPARAGHHFRGHFCAARGARTFDPKKPVTHRSVDREGVGCYTPLLPSPRCRTSMLRSTWARCARGASHIGNRHWEPPNVSQAWPPVGKGAARELCVQASRAGWVMTCSLKESLSSPETRRGWRRTALSTTRSARCAALSAPCGSRIHGAHDTEPGTPWSAGVRSRLPRLTTSARRVHPSPRSPPASATAGGERGACREGRRGRNVRRRARCARTQPGRQLRMPARARPAHPPTPSHHWRDHVPPPAAGADRAVCSRAVVVDAAEGRREQVRALAC